MRFKDLVAINKNLIKIKMSDLASRQAILYRVYNGFGSMVTAREVLIPSLTCSLFSTF